ncbi:tumor necrosis factor receptor superfamily member 14-like isoform X3 [Mixophyes fleayi]|uniref:tumor necrosis factor receptor superfamily member 14-like isoform X3 n=1 Tax=Mixophyes fleayi TaxID=3061075 RepID=UPI003F4DD0DD
MNLLIISLYLTILRTIVLCCNPGEYKINDVCCPMCPAGTFVKDHCTATCRNSVCLTCIEGTYMNFTSGLIKCLTCKNCDPGVGLVEMRKCTNISDTMCDCRDGYFCPEDDEFECNSCQEHRKCEPGQYVKAFGTARTDTVCEDCLPGHFSNESMSAACTPWRECSFLSVEKAGTSKSDSKCKRRVPLPQHLSVVLFCALITTVIGQIMWKARKIQKIGRIMTYTAL